MATFPLLYKAVSITRVAALSSSCTTFKCRSYTNGIAHLNSSGLSSWCISASILWLVVLSFLARLGIGRFEGLLEIGNDIVDVLETDRYSYQIL